MTNTFNIFRPFIIRNAVTDYLLNLEAADLVKIAADFLGWVPDDINYDTALEWVDGLSNDEVETIWKEMEANQ